MATTAENLAAINAAIDADPGLNSGFRARAKRDDTVLKVLEQIKTKVGTDKEQYITSALAEAKAYVEANKEALIKLKELRAQSPVDDAAVSALFAANNGEGKDLVTARAYLIVGAGLAEARPDDPNAKIFAEILDKDATTQKFTDANIDEKLIYSITDAAKNTSSTVDDLHKACTDAASAEILAIRTYLEGVKKSKEEAARTTPPPATMTKDEADKIIAEAYGISIDDSGKIKVQDASKAIGHKFAQTDAFQLQDGDVLAGFYTQREKGMSKSEVDLPGTDKIQIAEAIKKYGTLMSFCLKLKRGDADIFIEMKTLSADVGGPEAKGNQPAPSSQIPQCGKFGISYVNYDQNSRDPLYKKTTEAQIRNGNSMSLRGAILSVVTPGSPAENFGLRVGDVIVGFNGSAVTGPLDLDRLLEKTEQGKSYTIEFWTVNSQTHLLEFQTKTIKTDATRPQTQGLGVTIQQHREGWFGGHPVNAVNIAECPRDSLAYLLGLRQNMHINMINGKQVANPNQFMGILTEEIKSGREIVLGLTEPFGRLTQISIPAGTNFYGNVDNVID